MEERVELRLLDSGGAAPRGRPTTGQLGFPAVQNLGAKIRHTSPFPHTRMEQGGSPKLTIFSPLKRVGSWG